jgi:sugar lactone lactonase YvrE
VFFLLATSFAFGWNSTGITLAGVAGSSGTSATQLSNPYGMALDSSNTIYISDRNNSRVQKFLTGSLTGTTVAGQSNGVAGSTLSYLNYPSELEVDSSGNIYVVDSHNHRVLFWPSGSSTGTIVAGSGNRFTKNIK